MLNIVNYTARIMLIASYVYIYAYGLFARDAVESRRLSYKF